MQNFIPLESIQIATPCHADWNKMNGDDRARHCQTCAKNVYNLSSMTRAEAERLIQEKEGHLCVRLYRRADGTVLTSDCPVGISPLKKSVWAVEKVLVGAVASVLGLLGLQLKIFGATNGAPTLPRTVATTGIVAPTMGEPSYQIMGRMVRPTPTPTPKAVKIPSKAAKSHGNRTSGNKHPKSAKQHRRHR